MIKINHKERNVSMTFIFRLFCCWAMMALGGIVSGSGIADVNAQGIPITGNVRDNFNDPLPGVAVVIRGSSQGTTTDPNGEFSITAQSDTSVLVFSYMGFETQQIIIGNRRVLSVKMSESAANIEELVITAFGTTQKKGTEVAAVTTVQAKDLKVPSSNLTTAFSGRIAGLISYQRSGEPGQDNADFFIRGVTTFGYKQDPLILIDGVELTKDDLARMQVDDIASFSIMKDATATALYGARGANGVILVTTKEGREGKAKFNVRYEHSFSQPTRKVELADPITFMKMNNEAVMTRALPDQHYTVPHSLQKIEYTEQGLNPMVFPAVDWYSMLLKDVVYNQRINASISGGGNIARYYVSGTYNRDQGNLKVDKRNNFNNNINLNKYVLRSNVNVNVTKSTEVIVRLHGTMDDYTGPIDGGTNIYRQIMQTSPIDYPPYYEPDRRYQHATYILFGNRDGTGLYCNPYANMVKGYRQSKEALMMAQFELKQNLNFITDGLKIRSMFNTNRRSRYQISRQYIPYFFHAPDVFYDVNNDTYRLDALNPLIGTDFLTASGNDRLVVATTYWENALTYDRTFANKHEISGLLVYIMRDNLSSQNSTNLQQSLPTRNIGLSGRTTYSYDSRYYVEFNFGYNGSERFIKEERWGFFPSAGAGWIVSNEKFWTESLKNTISKLKLKATFGLVGNDAIGSEDDRFFYLSDVNLNSAVYGHTWGWGMNFNSYPGVMVNRYANAGVTWETSQKTNIGIELELFKQLEIQVDLYRDYRYNILQERTDIPGTMGLQSRIKANLGEAMSKGVDFSADYKWSVTRDLWVTGRANFTYANNEFLVYEEKVSDESPWQSRVGQHINQRMGYVAERLFVDDAEVRNSPSQSGLNDNRPVRGGDVKYRSITGNETITSLDRVPIGFPTTPMIVYGFGFSAGYKGFDLSCFFQGSAMTSFWLDHQSTSPFHNNTTSSNQNVMNGARGMNQVLKAYADSHWSEANQDIYALWPRLSETVVTNNAQVNTWFMQNGSFVRLKSVEFGYSFPKTITERLMMSSLRIYYSGTNLLCFSKFKLWDPEMAGNGLGYPIQRVHNIGVNVSF